MNLFLIAEIGINHNGDIDIAKKLIKSAADAGFDAVKFQKRTIDKVYTKEFLDSHRESPWGKTQRDQKLGLEFNEAQYSEIDKYCSDHKIAWSASAWDEGAQLFLQKFNLPFNKIASPMLGNKRLLKLVAKEKKKTFISTGMSTIDEIDQIAEIFAKENCEYELMHCNSTYPMQIQDANLLCIPMLKKRFGVNVGYSGHESSLLKHSYGSLSAQRPLNLRLYAKNVWQIILRGYGAKLVMSSFMTFLPVTFSNCSIPGTELSSRT